MTWVKLDDGFFRGHKARGVGRDARILYVAGLCYCATSLTDGHIPKVDVVLVAGEAGVSPRQAKTLADAGLWVDHGSYFDVPDYLDYNPSRERVLRDREAAKERKRKSRHTGSHTVTDARTDAVSHASGHESLRTRAAPTPLVTGNPTAPPELPDKSGGDPMEAAARLLAEQEADRRGAEVGNPDGYIRSRQAPIRRQHEDTWRRLLDASPGMTAADLVKAVGPREQLKRPDPTESTAAAAARIYDLNAQRARGEACERCEGAGQVFDSATNAASFCPDCNPAWGAS